MNTNMPSSAPDAVTVVVPTHNRADVLPQTLRSILAQRDVAVEVIVVDDASTDGTQQALDAFTEITVVRHETPTLQARARNRGAQLADTEWLAFCDDDDIWAPTKLAEQLAAMRAAGAQWCACSALFVDADLRPIGGHRVTPATDLVRLLPLENAVPGGGSGVLMSTGLFDYVGGFREDATYVEDWDLWLQLSGVSEPACVDRLLVAQRQWARSFSRNDFDAQYAAFSAVVNRYGRSTPRARPRHTGYFELDRRLHSESRLSAARHVPRLLARSPEDWKSLMAAVLLTRSARTDLALRMIGRSDVDEAQSWLAPHSQASPATSGVAGTVGSTTPDR